jgi:hypothetical protein
MHTFGASAPLRDVERRFGFSPERVAEVAREVLERGPSHEDAAASPERPGGAG